MQLDLQTHDPTLPLSLLQTLACGGERVIAPTLNTIFDAMALGGPTHIGAPPSFWSMVADDFAQQRAAKGRDAARQHLRKKLGVRAKVLTSGGGFLARATQEMLRSDGQLELNSLYGCREVGGIARNGAVYPGVTVRVRLADGRVAASGTGEALVRSARLSKGYVGDAAATADRFVAVDGERYYRTGDIVSLTTSSGGAQTVYVVGRAEASVKLASGRWVSTDEMEAAFESCVLSGVMQAAVAQAAVVMVGSDGGSETAAVIVLNVATAEVERVVTDEVAQQLIAALYDEATAAERWGIPAEALPRRVCFVGKGEAMTAENGLVTGSGKKRVAAIAAHFAASNGYKYHTVAGESDATSSATDDDADAEVAEMAFVEVAAALRRLVPQSKLRHGDGSTQVRASLARRLASVPLLHLGADSFLIARIVGEVRQRQKEHAELQSIRTEDALRWTFSTANDLLLGRLPSDQGVTVGAAAVVDWTRELCGGRATSPPSRALLPTTADGAVRCDIALVGPTGFLGPVVAALLLQQLLRPDWPTPSARLICIGRRGSGGGGRGGTAQRLRKALGAVADAVFPESSLLRVLLKDDALLLRRLVVVEADILSASDASRIGVVVLNAAKASHMAPYDVLRGANVEMALAVGTYCAERGLPLVFVRSIAAAKLSACAACRRSGSSLRRTLRDSAASGSTGASSARLCRAGTGAR